MKLIFPAIALALCGCASTGQTVVAPHEYLIRCDAAGGWNDCYSSARTDCPGGYETLSSATGTERNELRVLCPSPGNNPQVCGQHPREEADGIRASARAASDWVQQGGDCNTATPKPPAGH